MIADERVTAPLGARQVKVTGAERYGAYTVLHCHDGEGPEPQAGQFYMLRSAERWGGGAAERPYLPRAFSVLRSLPKAGTVELHFLIEVVGPGTKRLNELRTGDALSLVGPLGRGFAPPREDRRPLLVGGGVGIAPLAICQDELGAQTPVLLGFRDAAHATGSQLLNRAHVATDDGSVGHHGLVTDLLAAQLEGDERFEVYACGPPAMLASVQRLCAERDIPAQLALEAGMACGYGACFGCVVPTARGLVRLCLEGPVLEGAELSAETFAVPGMGHSG